MEVTHNGVTGLVFAQHVKEESSTALIHAPIPDQQTEREIAVDWDQHQNHEDVTRAPTQVKVS